MKVIVIGAGVIGTSTAYWLAKVGYDVTVMERRSGPGLQTSFANAGLMAFESSAPWATPDLPLKALKWLLTKGSPLSMWPDGSLWQGQWRIKMLRNCTRQRYHVHRNRLLTLARFSKACIDELREENDIDYEGLKGGSLQIFRSRKEYQDCAKQIAALKNSKMEIELLDAEGCVRIENALERVKHKLVGGLHYPKDESGDCHLFTTRLADLALSLGVRFVYEAAVERFDIRKGAIEGICANDVMHSADQYVVACGAESRALLAPLGIRIPTYPVKGYSITVPVRDPFASPTFTLLDETFKVAITRFRDRVRVGGMAELGGFDRPIQTDRKAMLMNVLSDLFPAACNMNLAVLWSDFRSMTPDNMPVVCQMPYPNLWLNTGHGTLGWTLACGSARLLADLIAGQSVPRDMWTGWSSTGRCPVGT